MTTIRFRQFGYINLLVAAITALSNADNAIAEESLGAVTVQNHNFAGSKADGYTNGIFLSRIRMPSPNENDVDSSLLLDPTVTWLGMPKPTLASSSLGQIMITPHAIEQRIPDPNDVPYVGELVFRSANVYVHDDVADLLALNLGVLGPASGAAQMQRFIHSTLNDTRPRGWSSQGRNKPFVAIDAYRAWRYHWPDSGNGRTSGDFVTLGGAALGNQESSVGVTLLARYGTNLDRSFPTVARLNGRSGDPIAIDNSWFAYTGFSADRIVSNRGIGSSTPGNNSQLRKTQVVPVVGIAYGWLRSSLTFSLQSATPLIESGHHRQSYGSITYIWH